MNKYKYIGKPVVRTKGREKITGKAKFGADYVSDLVMYVYRSKVSHALINNINIDEAQKITGIHAIITSEDVPGQKIIGPINQDQPVLADKIIRHRGEAIALIVASNLNIAKKAASKIRLDLELLTPIFSPLKSLEKSSVKIHENGNILDQMKIERGNLKGLFSKADAVVEGNYKTPINDHAYIEPNAGIGEYKNGKIIIKTATQMPHADRRNLANILDLPLEKIRIKQTMTGGGFGGKLESYIPLYLGLAVYNTKKKIKLVFSREEEIKYTVKRHPFLIKVKIAGNNNGKILGMKANIVIDTGAYGSYGIGVLVRALVHATGPYLIPNVKLDGRLVYTNNLPTGAMRGFGVPQINFAIESELDKLAKKLNISPIKLRLNNCLHPGDKTATGQKLDQSVGIEETITTAQKKLIAQLDSYKSNQNIGIGCSCMWYGIGKTTVPNPSEVRVELQKNGKVKIYTGAAGIGQGSTTVFQQIAAEELNLELNDIKMITADTEITPDSGVTSASRQTYITGKAIQNACKKLKEKVKHNINIYEFDNTETKQKFTDKINWKKVYVSYYQKSNINKFKGYFDPVTTKLDEKGQGTPYPTYAYGTHIAIVEVNDNTGEVKVLKIIASHDVGQTINKLNVEGQIEGGSVMGVGHALLENVCTDKGKILNKGLSEYLIPTALDCPEIDTIIIEEKEDSGPFGAKGVGECASIPTTAAIGNAIYDALGIRLTSYPFTPEKILEKIELI